MKMRADPDNTANGADLDESRTYEGWLADLEMPTPDRCVFCGEEGEFEDGLRCKMCAEADEDHDA